MVLEGEQGAAPDLNLDAKTEKGFVTFFQSLPQEASLIRFFDRKDFYSVHGESALFVARTFYKSTNVVKYAGGANGLPGITLNNNLFETVLRELLVERAEYTVQIYEGTGSQWRKTKEASPGKLGPLEEILFKHSEMADAPVVAAVSLGQTEGQRSVGVAFANLTTRQLGACEFADDEQFCSLEAVLLQLAAKEVVVALDGARSAGDTARLRSVVESCNAMVSQRPAATFSAKHLEQDLAKLLKSRSVEQHRDVLDRTLAAAALAGVMAFSEVTADSAALGRCHLELYDAGRCMRLDAAAQRALNVMRQRTDANDAFSLYGLMNRARTAMAKRLLKVWLKQPLVNLDDINCRLNVVQSFVEDPTLRESLRDMHLRGLPDIERLNRKLERRKISLADLCQLYRASSRLPMIEQSLREHEGEHAELLCARFADVLREAHDQEHLTKFEELLEAAVDLDRIPDEYLVCASYDAGLQVLSKDKDAVERKIGKLASDIADDLGLSLDKTVKLDWHKVSNTRTRCLRITSTEEKKVRKQLQSRYMTLETRKDGTKFTSRALKDAAESLQTISRSYSEKQAQLVDEVVGVAQSFCEVWDSVATALAELDVLLGFADLAVSAPLPYVRPQMLPATEGRLELEGCRHPCVEAQDGVDFIRNDCRLVRGDSWFQIITGPNMGGKSTYIRQVGVCVLMAQVGCFVPCDSACIAVRDAVFARVGAGDCQLRGVSTFMAEMLETAAILKGATERSLVIIDELGRGTSTYDGFGLAWAISQHLMAEIGCPTLFATHFHELTALQGPGGVSNQHVETAIDEATGRLTMLYRVAPGACDQSFGIHVAEFAQFPPEVVALAKAKAAELEDFSDAGAQVGAKRKREGSDSAAAVREFLQAFAALPLDQLQPEAARQQTQSLFDSMQERAGEPAFKRLLMASS